MDVTEAKLPERVVLDDDVRVHLRDRGCSCAEADTFTVEGGCHMEWYRFVIYAMVATQMASWAWIQSRGGRLPDRKYLAFCGMMMIGQTGASIECILGHAWGTLAVQIFFFIFTAWGGIVRLREMRATRS
jgi:hypothetical protein